MNGDPLFVRFYLDEDFHPDLAAALRQHGHDCLSAVEAGMLGKSDEEQLTYGAAQGRCVLSFNIGDFAALAIAWSRAGRPHAGIVVAQQVSRRQLGRLLQRILHLMNTVTADEMANTFRYLPG
jgi:predicted nuclease of predicted toxin-antitoxin system